MIIAVAFVFGLILGGYSLWTINLIRDNMKKIKIIDNITSNYDEVYQNAINSNLKFKSRVNNIAYLSTNLKNHSDVEVMYMIDKQDVAIFKEGKCIYTSDLVNKDLINKLVSLINQKFHQEINDVVNILGMTFSKEFFEKTFKIKYDDIKDIPQNMSSSKSDISQIIEENENKFSIDSILDKINKVGIENLTSDEKNFLDNFSKNE